MRSYMVFNYRIFEFYLLWPCWSSCPAENGRSHRALYSAFLRTPWIDSGVSKKTISTISLDPVCLHLPTGSKNRKNLKNSAMLNEPENFSLKVPILYMHYRVIWVWDLEFWGPAFWKCAGKFFVPHGILKITIFYTFWKIDFYLS